jgi:tyrosyl-tRNA synthetase
LHPGDLKPALAKAINKILHPIREHFKTNPEAREILSLVRSFRVNKASEKSDQKSMDTK